MNRRFFHSRRVLPPLEVELPRQQSFRPAPQPPQTRTTLPNYRVRRPLPERPTEQPEQLSQKPCRFCHNLVPTTTYSEHLTFCPAKSEVQQQNTNSQDTMELESPQRPRVEPVVGPSLQEENINISNNAGPREIHLPSQQASNLESSEDHGSQPTQPEAQNIPIFNPFPGFPGNMHGEPMLTQALPHPNGQIAFPSMVHTGQEIQGQNQPAQPLNQPIFEPATTSATFRMRAIDGILNRLEEYGGGGTGIERRGILGLLGMLAGLHGVRAAHFGEFLSMINRERGLDREVMESLPVVIYTEEGFKNVEEESKKCSICLDCYEDQQEVKFLWCLHRFHKECVDQWLDKHTNCPFCKKDYSEALRNQGES